ncbi:MAG: ABC transporter ATP-binding protein [Actinomycetales bacterium]|nr:ABC transporter ATP-binding protein [Actinomycetales bacterium]
MTSSTLSLKGVTRRFKETLALDSIDLHVNQGELVALLGPSGCGKTTALRIIAGLDRPDSGHVSVGGVDISSLAPNKRNMGMVFQSYSLFPNMTAVENVAFGLEMRFVKRRERQLRAQELLAMVGLPNHAKRYPHQLSGGQQQRVALARALAFEPDVLLLDEPLSALDAQVRSNLRDEIRRLQLETGTTTIFVTHDQEEAMAMSDRVAVMNHGKIAQIAAPAELYHFPADAFVAGFVGQMNRIPAQITGDKMRILNSLVDYRPANILGTEVVALVRPENLLVELPKGARGVANAIVESKTFLGAITKVSLRVSDSLSLLAAMPGLQSTGFETGTPVSVKIQDGTYLAVEA